MIKIQFYRHIFNKDINFIDTMLDKDTSLIRQFGNMREGYLWFINIYIVVRPLTLKLLKFQIIACLDVISVYIEMWD